MNLGIKIIDTQNTLSVVNVKHAIYVTYSISSMIAPAFDAAEELKLDRSANVSKVFLIMTRDFYHILCFIQ